MRRLALLALVGCWRAPTPQPHAQQRPVRRDVSLAIDRNPPGELVIDREGGGWQVHCDGHQLFVRPWQGGEARPAGPCAHEHTGNLDADDYFAQLSPIAVDKNTVAIYLPDTHELVITSPRGEQRIPIGDMVRSMAIAIDGDAIVLVIGALPAPTATIGGTNLGDAMSAIVRIEGAKIAVTPLVRYRTTGPEVAPQYIAMGPARMLLVGAGGTTKSCDYHGACSAQRVTEDARNLGDLEQSYALPDGGMVVMDFEHSISRLAPDGHRMWTTNVYAFSILGATADHVWVKTFADDPRSEGFPIRALALGDGAQRTAIGIAREQRRDPLGRFLQIHALAATPAGTVVRGEFAGALDAGTHHLETTVRGAICWWENPHDGDEHEIPLDGTCSDQFRKAILTTHARFVAVNPPGLKQRER